MRTKFKNVSDERLMEYKECVQCLLFEYTDPKKNALLLGIFDEISEEYTERISSSGKINPRFLKESSEGVLKKPVLRKSPVIKK